MRIENAAAYGVPDPGNPSIRRSFNKLALAAVDLDTAYEEANAAGADLQSTLRDSKRLGGYLILLDPNGNWIKVFGD